jgi:hypothetical protein
VPPTLRTFFAVDGQVMVSGFGPVFPMEKTERYP